MCGKHSADVAVGLLLRLSVLVPLTERGTSSTAST